MRIKKTISSVLLAALCTFGGAQAATLFGSDATGTLFWPNLATALGGPTTATIGAGLEFPAESILGHTLFTVDITENQLIYRPLVNVTYGSGSGVNPYNGFVFDFAGAPTILNVTINGGSNFSPVSFGFTGNSMRFDLANVAVNQSSVLIFDFQLEDDAAVPEPMTWSLMLLGFVSIGLFTARRRRVRA